MKRAVVILAIACALLGVVAIRAVVAGRAALAEGDAARTPADAIRAYEAAARWYVPLAPHVETAYRKLHALTGSPDALAAWRAIRSAARATRSLWQPHAAELAEADAAIAKLAARDPDAGIGEVFGGSVPSSAKREAWLASRLAADPRPDLWAAILASIGILVGLGGVGFLVARGVSAKGRLVRSPALQAGAAIAVGLACWLVGLYNA